MSITEIELNPLDSDSGKEWLELYSDSKLILEDYYLENEDGDIYNLTGSIQGYLVINFEKQWLDNSKTIIYLKEEKLILIETPELSDSKNDNSTLNFCNNSYILIESSKGEENNCPSNNKEAKMNVSLNQDNKLFLNKDKEEKLILSNYSRIRLYLVYFFTFFSILIIILIYLRKL